MEGAEIDLDIEFLIPLSHIPALKSCIFTLWKSDFKVKNAKLHWPGGTPY